MRSNRAVLLHLILEKTSPRIPHMNENARRTDCRNGGVILCRIVSGLEAKLWIGDGNAGGVCLLICPVDESDFSAVYSNRKEEKSALLLRRVFVLKGEEALRLDKYLKVSRIIKRRTVANDAASGQRVSVNGRVVKPAHQVKPGDIIEIAFGERRLKVEVLETPEHAPKENAAALYRVLDEE